MVRWIRKSAVDHPGPEYLGEEVRLSIASSQRASAEVKMARSGV